MGFLKFAPAWKYGPDRASFSVTRNYVALSDVTNSRGRQSARESEQKSEWAADATFYTPSTISGSL